MSAYLQPHLSDVVLISCPYLPMKKGSSVNDWFNLNHCRDLWRPIKLVECVNGEAASAVVWEVCVISHGLLVLLIWPICIWQTEWRFKIWTRFSSFAKDRLWGGLFYQSCALCRLCCYMSLTITRPPSHLLLTRFFLLLLFIINPNLIYSWQWIG